MGLKVLVLGINGFIGCNLTKKILKDTDWELYGMDLSSHKLTKYLANPRLHFTAGDMLKDKEWVREHLQKCDVVLPLVAIANPAIYIKQPLRIFELDFEANLEIIKQCVVLKKRVIFPSTSEVYGMSPDFEFNEETSPLMQGPIQKERWIYSCCKQLLDRVIYANGNHHALPYTLFRPFNWIGPEQDEVNNPNASVRVVPQFICNIMHSKDLQLVDGGAQRRCFIYIDDGIDALVKIIENKDGCADSRIFNIGYPANDASIHEIAEKILAYAKKTKYKVQAEKVKIISTDAKQYYGSGYQDMKVRVPCIKNAIKYLNWQPSTKLDDALRLTVEYYLKKF